MASHDPTESAFQRAGSFGRRTSWRFQLSEFAEVERLVVTDVNQMAKYSLPFDLLITSDVGSTSSLAQLQGDIDSSLSNDRCDTYLQDPLRAQIKYIETVLQALCHTRINTSNVPTDFMHKALRNAENYTAQVRERQSASKHVQQQQESLNPSISTKLAAVVQLELEPRFTEELLPTGGRRSLEFREGWQDEWWQAGRRLQAARVLEEKRKQWSRDTELDRLGGETIGLLREQVKYIHTQLDVVADISKLQQSAPSAPSEVIHRLEALERENTQNRENALADMTRVDTLVAETEAKDRAATAVFQRGFQHTTQFLQGTVQRLHDIDARMKNRDLRYQEEREVLILTGGKLGANATALALQQEVVNLRVQLKEKEEALAREVDLWAQKQREQETELKADFEARMAELESSFQVDLSQLQAIRDLLKKEEASMERLLPQREYEEQTRKQEVSALLAALKGRREALESTAQGYTDLLTTTKLVKEVHDTLYTATQQMLEERWQEAVCGEVDMQLQGLEVASKLHKLLITLDTNLKLRLIGVDRTVADLNKLIEFSVDTYDPNAHLYKDALEDSLEVRRRVQKLLVEHAQTHTWLRREAAHFYQMLNASAMLPQDTDRLQRLQRLYRDFFDLLPARVGEEPPPVVIRFNEAPRSMFVSTVRKPPDSVPEIMDARPHTADAAAAPFKRLPILGGQQWSMEPVEEPSPVRPQTAAARIMGLPSSPPRVQQEFDHREFVVYKHV